MPKLHNLYILDLLRRYGKTSFVPIVGLMCAHDKTTFGPWCVLTTTSRKRKLEQENSLVYLKV